MNKAISIKPILKIMKELKADRIEWQNRVNNFNSELAEKINRHNILVQEMGEVQHRIAELRHLVKMYKVMDGHKIMDLWELETACGLTKKKFLDWKFDFEKTKDGRPLKV